MVCCTSQSTPQEKHFLTVKLQLFYSYVGEDGVDHDASM